MSLKTATSFNDVRTRLARILGFHDYPSIATGEPYMTYITKSYGGTNAEDYLELFIAVISHFDADATVNAGDDSIQALIDKLTLSGFRGLFADTQDGDLLRREHVEDTVMCIIGIWTAMLTSFQNRCGSRRVTEAYKIFSDTSVAPTDALQENVAGLVAASELLPGGRWDKRTDSGSDAALRFLLLLSNTPTPNQSSFPSQLMQSAGSRQTSSTRK